MTDLENVDALIDKAIDKFRYDMGFTAPELFDMRIEELRVRLHNAVRQADGIG